MSLSLFDQFLTLLNLTTDVFLLQMLMSAAAVLAWQIRESVTTPSTCTCVSVILDSVVVTVKTVSCNQNLSTCTTRNCKRRNKNCHNIRDIFSCLFFFKDCRSEADVAIVVDASGSVGPENFRKQVSFLQELAMSLPVGISMQLALETYSSTERVYIYFSDYESKRSILNALSVPYLYGGSTNTAGALRRLRNEVLTSRRGDLPENENILLLITDGWSNRPGQTWEEAMILREAGVHIIAVGIGNAVKDGELAGKQTAEAGP